MFWYASCFFIGWAVLNVILTIMRQQKDILFMIAIPSLVASIGWIYSEYKLMWRE
jgi:membrane protein DedA with SNARE-associated domain